MTDIKFECPVCGQHMECDRACGGDVIHCPRCCAELRVPFADGTQIDAMKRAELLAPMPPAPTVPTAPAQAPASSGLAEDGQVAKPAPKPEPLEVSCPVCRSELRIGEAVRAKAKPNSPPPMAELLRKGPDKPEPAPVPPAADSAPDGQGKTEKHHLTVEEREQKIAAARQAHPIQVNTAMKPRLEYVLEDKTPPLVKEAQDAEAGRKEAKEKIVTE